MYYKFHENIKQLFLKLIIRNVSRVPNQHIKIILMKSRKFSFE